MSLGKVNLNRLQGNTLLFTSPLGELNVAASQSTIDLLTEKVEYLWKEYIKISYFYTQSGIEMPRIPQWGCSSVG